MSAFSGIAPTTPPSTVRMPGMLTGAVAPRVHELRVRARAAIEAGFAISKWLAPPRLPDYFFGAGAGGTAGSAGGIAAVPLPAPCCFAS